MTRPFVELTPRERDVVRGVVAGRTNREIATALGITIQAVKNVLTAVYAKCQVRNRVELALNVMRNDLDIDDSLNDDRLPDTSPDE